MSRRSSSAREKKSLLDYSSFALAVLAFLFSMYQFFVYRDVDKKIKELTAENTRLDNDIKRAEATEREYGLHVQFENRYIVASEGGITTILDYNKAGNNFVKSVVKNKVLDDFDV